jgi:hypothetical protein
MHVELWARLPAKPRVPPSGGHKNKNDGITLHERYLIKPTDALSSCYSYESLRCVLVSWLISCTFGLHSHLRPLVTPLHSRSPSIPAQLCTLRTSVGVAMAAPMLPAVAPATSFFQNGSPPSAQTHTRSDRRINHCSCAKLHHLIDSSYLSRHQLDSRQVEF